MFNIFRSSHTTAATQTPSAQPSVFDILAQQSQSQSLKPALKYALQFASLWLRNKRFSRSLEHFDELYALLMLAIEDHFLRRYGGSFTENFYSMKRVFSSVPGAVLTRAQRMRSLVYLVFIPYIESKLSSYRDKIDQTALHNRTPFMNLFLKWYPVFTKILGIISVAFLILYAFNWTTIQSLPLYLIGARLSKLTPADLDALSSVPIHLNSGILGRASRVLLSIPAYCGRIFSYALFFKDAHAFVQENLSEEHNKTLKFTPDAVLPTHPRNLVPESELVHMDAGKCPICHKTRENDTVLIVSGFVFCFACINASVRADGCCPITKIPATPQQLIRLYKKSA